MYSLYSLYCFGNRFMRWGCLQSLSLHLYEMFLSTSLFSKVILPQVSLESTDHQQETPSWKVPWGEWNLRQQKLLFPKSSLSARLFEETFTLHKTNTFHLAEENHRLKLVPIFGMGIWHSSPQEIYCQSVMMNLISYRLSTLLKGTWHQFPSFHQKSLAFWC